MAVLDPALERDPRSHEIEQIHRMFPSLPLLLYTSLNPSALSVMLQIGRLGVRQVIVADHDDHPKRVADVLVEEAAHAVSRRLLGEIGDVLETMPSELQWAIQTVVRDPGAYHNVQDLATRARMDRRTCSRWFTKAHLPPPKVILTALRVVYAHRLLQDPGYTVEDVATRLGYQKPRSFAEHVKEVLGVPPADSRVSITVEEAIHMVRQRYFNGNGVLIAEAS